MAEMAVPVEIPSMIETHPSEGMVADFSLPAPTEEYAPGEFAIPDIDEHPEESADNAALAGALDTFAVPEPAPELPSVAPPPPKWVAEPVPVSPEDHAHFGEVAKSAEPSKKKDPETPPDWGDLLKSVEETGVASIPPPAAVAAAPIPIPPPAAIAIAPIPVPPPPAPSISAVAAAPAPSSDLELEIPVEEPPPPPPPPPAPTINEEDLRLAVQLCLESALPSLVDEITSAVLRRLQTPS
jgi:hypothetical protein